MRDDAAGDGICAGDALEQCRDGRRLGHVGPEAAGDCRRGEGGDLAAHGVVPRDRCVERPSRGDGGGVGGGRRRRMGDAARDEEDERLERFRERLTRQPGQKRQVPEAHRTLGQPVADLAVEFAAQSEIADAGRDLDLLLASACRRDQQHRVQPLAMLAGRHALAAAAIDVAAKGAVAGEVAYGLA